MTNKYILKVALPTPVRHPFDYLPPANVAIDALNPGIRLTVPFRKKTLVGILVEVSTQTQLKASQLKCAHEILDETTILPPDIFFLCQWAANYYHYPLGEVFATALPQLVRQGKAIASLGESSTDHVKNNRSADQSPVLNSEQTSSVTAICEQEQFKVFLLDGVTGSGKTEVYLQVIAKQLAQQKQVLVLVPEISLTPQTIARFEARFAVPVVSLHSNLNEQQKLQAWLQARSGEARIVIGTRSAIFTPLPNLGLIVVDEEHDASFKQQDRFRYHARDLAIKRASYLNVPIILGSATPSLETMLNAKRQRYEYLCLPLRAGQAQLPTYELIDLRVHKAEDGLSAPLRQAIAEQLDAHNQVMIFLNRRGFAPVLYCTQCAWMMKCPHCDIPMAYHHKPTKLKCHHCDASRPVPKQCPACKATQLLPIGLGTQRIEESLKQHFPDTPILRIDRDATKRKGSMQALLDEIHTQQPAILLGTQMLAKGHHFPQVTLVGIIDIDNGLFSINYRAAEQMSQLLLQVSGRAGRSAKPGKVFIQTRHPEHPLLNMLLSQGYHAVTETLLNERHLAQLPPYHYFAVCRAQARKEDQATQFLQAVKQLFLKTKYPIHILGPAPALIPKRKNLYYQHLLIKASDRPTLQTFLTNTLKHIEQLASAHSIRWILEIDPIEL